jgi:acyl carrier protein
MGGAALSPYIFNRIGIRVTWRKNLGLCIAVTSQRRDQVVANSVSIPTTIELIEELRRIYADYLEIPLEEVTGDADLAADLGVDSLTQGELAILAFERYGISDKASVIQSMSYPTIGELADLVQHLLDEENGGENR